jgi:hypothetical protein
MGTMTNMKAHEFYDMSAAFDYCREMDRPIVVKVFPPGITFRLHEIFPSGSYRDMGTGNTRRRIIHTVLNWSDPGVYRTRAHVNGE